MPCMPVSGQMDSALDQVESEAPKGGAPGVAREGGTAVGPILMERGGEGKALAGLHRWAQGSPL